MSSGVVAILLPGKELISSLQLEHSMMKNMYGALVHNTLKMVSDRYTFNLFISKLVSEHFYYENTPLTFSNIFHKSKYSYDELLDLTEDYEKKWNVNYLYFKNATGHQVSMVIGRSNTKILVGFPNNTVAVFLNGVPAKGFQHELFSMEVA